MQPSPTAAPGEASDHASQPDEARRLAVLERYRILDTEPEEDYEDLTWLASYICQTPISLVSLVDAKRQWFKSNRGLDLRWTDRSLSFCAHAIRQRDTFVVRDTRADPRFAHNSLVVDGPRMRFYAGAQLRTPDDEALGTICVIDTVPRELSDEQLDALRRLARQTMAQMELRRQRAELQAAQAALTGANARLEQRVAERTAELAETARALREEMVERTRAEQALREREEALAQAQRLETLGRLAGGIAHDFNNLLTVIRGYAEAASEATREPETHADLDQVRGATERACALTSQLLAFARKQVHAPEDVALNVTVPRLVQMLSRLVGERVHIETDVPADTWLVRADPHQLDQVLTNLVLNARDAMPDGGRIHLRAENVQVTDTHPDPALPRGDFVRLDVADTGTGMSDEVLRHLFEPFFTTKPEGKGTGLGLATSYGAIRQCGGDIRVTSRLGHGTTFGLYLPRATGSGLSGTTETAQTDTAGRETVLVAEDDEAVRGLVVRELRTLGYAVLEAVDGLQALALLQDRDDVRLVVSDVVMPRLGGLELRERLKSVRPGVRVLLTSGHVGATPLPDDVDFLPKPYPIAKLAAKVRALLDGTGG